MICLIMHPLPSQKNGILVAVNVLVFYENVNSLTMLHYTTTVINRVNF
jgi:hypothetical protein